jgi:HEAT repeat protein
VRGQHRRALAGASSGGDPKEAQKCPEHVCPHCGERHDAATALGGGGSKPAPGDVMICDGCGGLGQFVTPTSLRKIALRDVPDAEHRGVLARAQRLILSERKGKFPPDYYRGARRLDALVMAALARGEVPRFALPDDKIAMFMGMDQVGEKLARNAAALALVRVACDVAPDSEPPTMNMLRAILSVRKIESEPISLAELQALGLIAVTELSNIRKGGPSS